jgi:hypothetical protein
MTNQGTDTHALEAEARALTYASQALRRYALVAPPDSHASERLDRLAADLTAEAEACCARLREALAQR